MAGYIGTKAVNLSTTGADINGNANVDGTLDVTGAFTSLGIDDNAAATAVTIDASGNVGIGTATPDEAFEVNGDLKISGAGFGIVQFGETSDQTKIVGRDGSHATQPNTMEFHTNTSERMRIDSSGNVGIGTASPSEKLSIVGAGNGTSFSNTTTSTSYNLATVVGNAGGSVKIGVDNSIGTAFSSGNYGGVIQSTNNLAFKAGGSERMRLDSSGNVLVGKTVDDLTTEGVRIRADAIDASRSSSAALNVCRTTTNGSAVLFYRDGVSVGSISVTGSATAYNTSSDYRLKENITPVQGAADIVKAMQPVTYTFKSDGSWHDGFLAHELQELHPRAVTGSKDAMKDEEYEVTPAVLDEDGAVVTEAVMGTRSVPDYQGVDYSKLTPILTAALQEALNKIDALETRLTALEATP